MFRLFAIALVALMAAPPAIAAPCVSKDSRYTYGIDPKTKMRTIVGKECTSSESLMLNGLTTATPVTCKGINPIGITMHQGELYSYDMVTGRDEMLVGECDPE